MKKAEYFELLKDPRWQRKRLHIMNRDGFECRFCGNVDDTLHVHHRYYTSGRKPWEYPDACYVTLCEGCHEAEKAPYEEESGELQSFAWERFLDVFGADGWLIAPFLRACIDFRNSRNLSGCEAMEVITKALRNPDMVALMWDNHEQMPPTER